MRRLLRRALCALAPVLGAAWSPCTRAAFQFADRSSRAVCTEYFRTQHMFPPPQSLRARVSDLPVTYPRLCSTSTGSKRRQFKAWVRRVLRACRWR